MTIRPSAIVAKNICTAEERDALFATYGTSLAQITEDTRRKELDCVSQTSKYQDMYERYKEAELEYFDIVGGDESTEAKVAAARFLRDSAENVILYFDELDLNAERRKNIIDLFETAKSVVQDLKGGKKRKFDSEYKPNGEAQRALNRDAQRTTRAVYRGNASEVQGGSAPRDQARHADNYRRSASPNQQRAYRRHEEGVRGSALYPSASIREGDRWVHGSEAYRVRDQYRDMDEQEHREYGQIPRFRSKNAKYSSDRPGHTDHAHYSGDVDVNREYQTGNATAQDFPPMQSPAANEDEKHGRRPNRGPSGIPYGYGQDRHVDSYKPDQY